jgi:hypothetical protein
MIVLWNAVYMEAVLEQLQQEGYPVNEEDKARLSPLIHAYRALGLLCCAGVSLAPVQDPHSHLRGYFVP